MPRGPVLRKNDEGKYFHYFTTKKAAKEYLDNLVEEWGNSKPYISMRNIVDREHAKGIYIPYKKFRVQVKYSLYADKVQSYADKTSDKVRTSVYMQESVTEAFRKYPSFSGILNFFGRMLLGLPTPNQCFVFVKPGMTAYFTMSPSKSVDVVFPEIPPQEILSTFRGLANNAATQQTFEPIKNFCRGANWQYYGE